MGRAQRRHSEAAQVTTGADVTEGTASIGRYLARERELRGISLDELCEITRLPRRSLERLEAGAYDLSPDGFARGFVRTVALALGLRPQDTLARMLPEADTRAREASARRRMPTWRTCVWVVASVVACVAIVLGARRFLLRPAQPAPVVYRLDAVRELWLETAQTERIVSEVERLDPEAPSAGPPQLAHEPAVETQSSAAH